MTEEEYDAFNKWFERKYCHRPNLGSRRVHREAQSGIKRMSNEPPNPDQSELAF